MNDTNTELAEVLVDAEAPFATDGAGEATPEETTIFVSEDETSIVPSDAE